MYAPKLYDLEVGRNTIQEFKGYNHNLRIGDNEFFDMQNMTGKYYPLLSPRGKRGVVNATPKTTIDGILGKDKLVTIITDHHNESFLCYDGEVKVALDHDINGERQLISMGAYVIVYPDMVYLNTADLNDCGPCFGKDYSFEGNTAFQVFAENGEVLKASNMIWGEEFFARDNIYINPSPLEKETFVKIFGLPASWSGNKTDYDHGNYNVQYRVDVVPNKNCVFKVGATQYNYISFAEKNDGWYILTNRPDISENPDAYYAYVTHNDEIIAQSYKNDVVFATFTIAATINGTFTLDRTIQVCARSTNGKFSVSGIEQGDRRMWFEDGATKSQICVRTEDTPEATYNTPSCWRDEATRVRVTVDTNFTEALRKTINEKEGHLLSINAAQVNDNPFAGAPLLEKYGDDKILAINSMTVVSGTEVDILGFLDFFDSGTPQSGSIHMNVTAMKPFFDYMIEANNRLWACRYGTDYKDDFVNEIYASARGSFRSFFKFDGTADDSYVLSLGSGGEFTGAANLNGNPVFFKEGFCHTIYGSYPSSYSLSTDPGTWVASGSHKSICVDEGTLFFHGKDGIYAYDGASKQLISTALGTERYKNAVGGCVDGKYYVSMQDARGKWSVFVFDRASGMWHREDDLQARFFAPHNGDLYIVDAKDRLVTVNGTEGDIEGAVEWYAESGKIGFVNPDNMYIGKIQLKLSLPVWSSIRMYIQYDSDEYWEFAGDINGKNSASFTVPIMPRSCDHFAIRLCGIGECKIFSMTKTYEAGGEV